MSVYKNIGLQNLKKQKKPNRAISLKISSLCVACAIGSASLSFAMLFNQTCNQIKVDGVRHDNNNGGLSVCTLTIAPFKIGFTLQAPLIRLYIVLVSLKTSEINRQFKNTYYYLKVQKKEISNVPCM